MNPQTWNAVPIHPNYHHIITVIYYVIACGLSSILQVLRNQRQLIEVYHTMQCLNPNAQRLCFDTPIPSFLSSTSALDKYLYRPGCCPANPGPSLVHPALFIPSSMRPQILSTTSLSLHLPFSLPVHLSTFALKTPLPKSWIPFGVSSPCHPTYIPG